MFDQTLTKSFFILVKSLGVLVNWSFGHVWSNFGQNKVLIFKDLQRFDHLTKC